MIPLISKISPTIQPILTNRGHFSHVISPFNVKLVKSHLVQCQIPHYVHESTRDRVRKLYRRLHRAGMKQMDPLVRHFLRFKIWEYFVFHSIETRPDRIRQLYVEGQAKLTLLENAITGNTKACNEVFRDVFGQYGIVNGPLSKVTGFSTVKKSTARSIHILRTSPPKFDTFDEYEAAQKANSHLFFKMINAIKSQSISSRAKTGSLLKFQLEREASPLGVPLSPLREKNIIKRHISYILNSMNYPIHSSLEMYFNYMVKKDCRKFLCLPGNKMSRFYKRRISNILETSYMIENGINDLKVVTFDSIKKNT